jgi:hypothetical protein
MKYLNCKTKEAKVKFCSRICAYDFLRFGKSHFKGGKVNFTCKECNNIFKVFPCFIETKTYCSRECMANAYKRNLSGKNNPFWKGGKTVLGGYIYVLSTNHPFADSKGYVREHRLVMEKYLGRYLNKKEVVHHKDRNKGNNDIKNLQLFGSHSEHMKIHKNNKKYGKSTVLCRSR